MSVALIAIATAVGFFIAYHTYGRWLGKHIFALSARAVCPSTRLNDGTDYVPTKKAIVFGHHFTSIAGTGPIVGPAIAVMWGWLPALLWVIFGSIFIGAVHDFGALVVSLRNNGQTVGDIAGRVMNKRVRILFLLILFMALTIVLAIFGLVIGSVFRMYPASIFPCTVQIPIAVGIGYWLHRRGVGLFIPSILALALMYFTVIIGDDGRLGDLNMWMASWPVIVWVFVLLVYSYVASVLPVWTLLQPRDYINSLQLLTALGLIVIGLIAAAIFGGAPPVVGAARQPLAIVAPMVNWHPAGAPMIFPFLFITIACGAVSGFHCLVSSGTSSKQLACEPDARFVGYGSMLTEGFLATLVILACVAGLGLGSAIGPLHVGKQDVDGTVRFVDSNRNGIVVEQWEDFEKYTVTDSSGNLIFNGNPTPGTQLKQTGYYFAGSHAVDALTGSAAFNTRYSSWGEAGSLGAKVGAFVEGAANFLKALGIPAGVAIALMGVLVASFAGTTLDTACRLQRYVVQELAATFLPRRARDSCPHCGYTLWQRGVAAKVPATSSTPEGSTNVATGQVNPGGMSAARGTQRTQHYRPGGADEVNDVSAPRLPLRGEEENTHASHGLRSDQRGAASPVATTADPFGAEETATQVSPLNELRCSECGRIVTPEQIERAGPSTHASRPVSFNPLCWLTNKHGATIFAVVLALIVAAIPPSAVTPGFWSTLGSDGIGGGWTWLSTNAGRGGMILWPLFGATNQLLAGLAFLVIAFYLRRRGKPLWFLILPMLFMLIMPMWALVWQLFVGNEDGAGKWFDPTDGSTNWLLVCIGVATIVLEIWMIVEAARMFPRVARVLEDGALDQVQHEHQRTTR